MNGHGVFSHKGGRKYEGEWTKGVMNGNFKYTNLRGNLCEGVWKDGKHSHWKVDDIN